MMSRLRAIAASLVLLLAAGCAAPPVRERAHRAPVMQPESALPAMRPVPGTTAHRDETARSLAYFDRLRRMSAHDLKLEQAAMRLAYASSHDDGDRVRLAMAYSVPGSNAADDNRALDLLDPIVKAPSNTLHDLAVLLSAFVTEQKRVAANEQSLAKQVQSLQLKLDALLSLDRSLNRREVFVPPPKSEIRP